MKGSGYILIFYDLLSACDPAQVVSLSSEDLGSLFIAG
jgi:hypothetical protein